MELYSLVFYHPEKGFLWGVNQEGQYDLMTGEWSDDYDPVLLISTLLNAEMMLYEIFYMQKRFDYQGVSHDLEGMRRKYVDLEEEMYALEIYMENQMKRVIWEWFMKGYKTHTVYMENSHGNHRYIILDISILESMEDVSMWMNLDFFYQQVMKKVNVQKQMVRWEWKQMKELRPWKSTDVVREIKDFLNVGIF
jgi:hypothetical protein